jgi:hypothetical protein
MDGGSPKAKKYRKLAAEVRAEAERVTVAQAKQVLLDIADRYERLADTLDANARRGDP